MPPRGHGKKRQAPAKPPVAATAAAPVPEAALVASLISEEDAPAMAALSASLSEDRIGGDIDRRKLFDRLSDLVIERAIDIMRMELKPAMPGFEKIMARQSAIIATIMSAQVRVDKENLRQRGDDKVGNMLAEMRALQRGEPPSLPDQVALFD